MRQRWVARGFVALLLGCHGIARRGDEAIVLGDVPEPTQALRPAAARGEVPTGRPGVDYDIDASLDAEAHRVDGTLRLTWQNPGPDPVAAVPLHLYMNGFRAEDTAWMRDARGSHRGYERGETYPWGYCDVQSVEDGQGRALRFAERPEPSLMDVTLAEPVAPGETLTLAIAFRTVLPEVFARTGWKDSFHLVGQWFPKLARRDPDGRFADFPFTLNSEFYADFGRYTVELDVPAAMIVGATGILVSEATEGDRKRLHYEAEQVHDFAWTAWPEFVEARTDIEGIRVRILVPPDREHEIPVHLEVQRLALRSMEARYGAYPWSTITIVLPPDDALGAGGMEYPTFYTTSPLLGLPPWLPSSLVDVRADGRFTTIHEFGHQYFQGLLASNEFAEPWLDEGVNSFANTMVLEDDADPDWIVRIGGHTLAMTDAARLGMADQMGMHPIARSAAEYDPALGTYGALVYQRTMMLLWTLRELAGREAFDRAFGVYTRRYRFDHPHGEDFVRTFVEELGARRTLGPGPEGEPAVELDVADVLTRGLHSAERVDFVLRQVSNQARVGSGGWHRDGTGELVGGEAPDATPLAERSDDELEGVVVVERRGDFPIPLEIEVEFGDGTRERFWWDARAKSRVFRWSGRRVVRAVLDPDNRLILEVERHDNQRYARRAKAPPGPERDLGRIGEILALVLMTVVGP